MWKSRSRKRPRADLEVRSLIRLMATENGWGAPRIHGEILKLGFDVSQRTVSRYMPRRKPQPEEIKRWMAFLRNHREFVTAMDFFTVPTATFRILYGFFIIHHHQRKIQHFNATLNPTAEWVTQQLREAFPYDSAPRYIIFDRDSIFSPLVRRTLKSMGIKPKRIFYKKPWQNGVAERWIESCRLEMLNHVVVLNEVHLVRMVREYITYYHEDRTHLSLKKDTPNSRPVKKKPSEKAKVVSLPRVGGLHHRYDWSEAA